MECKKCKEKIRFTAKQCPHCGKKTFAKEALALCLMIILIPVYFMLSDDESSKIIISQKTFQNAQEIKSKSDEQAQFEAEKLRKEKKKANCKNNLQCWSNKHLSIATILCKNQVEKLAKYTFKWTDGWLDNKFTHFRWKDQKNGIITYLGDKIQFQNGFGAYQIHFYTCDYNPLTKTVIEVRSSPGRL